VRDAPPLKRWEEARMATERLPMRKTKEILRLKWLEGHSHRHIARALAVSVGKVSAVVQRAAELGLDWGRVEELGEAELEEAFYGAVSRRLKAPLPDPAWLDLELKKPGVALQLLHLEYREKHPEGYGYTQFCEHYRGWKKRQKVVMRQVYRAGEKMFSDFAGKKPHWIDAPTGEVHEAELFVAVLGASNLTYAEALESQKTPHWVAAHTRALEYFGGAPDLVIPDYVPRHIIGVLCPSPLCGRPQESGELRGRSCSGREHNFSERSEPVEQRLVGAPDGLPGESLRRFRRGLAGLKGCLLGADVYFRVAIGGFQTDVAEPASNDVDVDARFEEMDGGRVPEDVR